MNLRKILPPVLILGLLLFFVSGRTYRFGTLTDLATEYRTDKGRGHYYTEVYEYFFYPIKYKARKICEIGVATGASMKMFRDYFTNAVIYGIDIEDASQIDSGAIKTFIADQSNRGQLKSFIDTYGSDFDLILDDGGHGMEQQQVSFGYLFRHLSPGGYYIIEDVNTSLLHYCGSTYGYEGNGENTTLTMINAFISNGKVKSRYMSREEESYLTENIEYCNLLSRNEGKSITCIFKKKAKGSKI